jgi:hypothetical protein
MGELPWFGYATHLPIMYVVENGKLRGYAPQKSGFDTKKEDQENLCTYDACSQQYVCTPFRNTGSATQHPSVKKLKPVVRKVIGHERSPWDIWKYF